VEVTSTDKTDGTDNINEKENSLHAKRFNPLTKKRPMTFAVTGLSFSQDPRGLKDLEGLR